MSKILKCSFCGKREDEVAKLVAGTGGHRSRPSVYICDTCVMKATDIMANSDPALPGSGNGSDDSGVGDKS